MRTTVADQEEVLLSVLQGWTYWCTNSYCKLPAHLPTMLATRVDILGEKKNPIV